MKNKYQEALEWYAEHTSFNKFNIDAAQWADETLQELVDKETPMKPCYGYDYPSGDCPICGNNIGDNPRCRWCGQKIDWSKDE